MNRFVNRVDGVERLLVTDEIESLMLSEEVLRNLYDYILAAKIPPYPQAFDGVLVERRTMKTDDGPLDFTFAGISDLFIDYPEEEEGILLFYREEIQILRTELELLLNLRN